MSTLKVPRVYPMTPLGPGPVYWSDEQSGTMAAAVIAYLDHRCDNNKPAPTQEQIDLIVDYCDYWINAPCWKGEGLVKLMESIKMVRTEEELAAWFWAALDEGIDPL